MEPKVNNKGRRLPREEKEFHRFYNRERKYCMTLSYDELENRLRDMALRVYHAKFMKAAVLDEMAIRRGEEAKYKTRILG